MVTNGGIDGTALVLSSGIGDRTRVWENVFMKVSLVALVLVSAPCVALAQSSQDWKSCTADDAEDFAISACTRLLETNELRQEDRAIAYYNRGAARWRKRDFDTAIADENEAIEINPKLANAYMRRGAAYGGKGDYDRAIADENEAIEIDPENVRAYSDRGLFRGDKHDDAGAIADATRAIEIDPQFRFAYGVRGNAYGRGGDYAHAIADFTTEIEIDPKNAFAYEYRANIYARKGDDEPAIADASRAVEINPNYVDAYSVRAFVYERKRDFDRAIADYNKIIEIDPKNASAYKVALGKFYGERWQLFSSVSNVNQAYGSQLVARLERNKHFPTKSLSGVVEVGFAIDPLGHLLSTKIVKSSGFPALDRAAIALVERSQPFPIPPSEVINSGLNFSIPVTFKAAPFSKR
jgi:TonB family protein